jgi:hypothetical protein
MDCSVQYTESGACPEEEIRERGRGVHTGPRAWTAQLWNGIGVDIAPRFLVERQCYSRFEGSMNCLCCLAVLWCWRTVAHERRGGRAREDDDDHVQFGRLPWRLAECDFTSSCSCTGDDYTRCMIAAERNRRMNSPAVLLYDILER